MIIVTTENITGYKVTEIMVQISQMGLKGLKK